MWCGESRAAQHGAGHARGATSAILAAAPGAANDYPPGYTGERKGSVMFKGVAPPLASQRDCASESDDRALSISLSLIKPTAASSSSSGVVASTSTQ